MIVKYKQFYKTNKYGWLTKRAAIVDETPFCVDCRRYGIRLEVHHIFPINWQTDENGEKFIEVSNPYKELVNVPLEPLCHSCHMAREKGGDILDIATLFVGGKL